MNEQEALSRMVAPGQRRKGKYMEGVIQIHVTRACDLSCFNCTQGSNLGGKTSFISLEHFEQACISLKDYFGVVGVFGGNPAVHPQFLELCSIMSKHIPYERRGIWCNNAHGKASIMRGCFNPRHSNINVHLNKEAADEFRKEWPEVRIVGEHEESRHSPVYVAMKDVINDEGTRWELISDCDINHHWSAMIGVFRGELRAWFCEVAGAQAMLHQDDPDYPDTGMNVNGGPILHKDVWYDQWWQLPMTAFAHQVRKHCHECSVPLRGYGELSQANNGKEQTSQTHASIYKAKRKGRAVEVVTDLVQLNTKRLKFTQYLQGSSK